MARGVAGRARFAGWEDWRMSWFTLRVEGVLETEQGARTVRTLIAQNNLEALMARLCLRCQEEAQVHHRRPLVGVEAALAVQGELIQWVSSDACTRAERLADHPFPTIHELRRIVRGSGSSSLFGAMGTAGPGSPRT